MKHLILPLLFLACTSANTQVSGNANYSQPNQLLQEQNFQIQQNQNIKFLTEPKKNEINVSIKGMANIKADNYVAIFALTQVGKTVKQTDSLFNERMKVITKNIKNLDSINLFVDMVSFVPLYDVVLEKRFFSPDTYNEVPDGFEIKKNIHIHYKNQAQLSNIISICAKAEIYNLIKVDYSSQKLDEVKLQLLKEAKLKLDKRLEHYKLIVGEDFNDLKKSVVDGFQVVYPIDQYLKCIAYNNNSFKTKVSSRSNQVAKNQAQYYQPIANKNFDFVLNPLIVEPVIQVMYELKVILFEKEEDKTEKQFMLITPNGDLKPIAKE